MAEWDRKGVFGGEEEGGGVRSGPGEARTILLFHIISVRPPKQPLMERTFLKVYMELCSYFLFLQEQIKDIIIIDPAVVAYKGAQGVASCTREICLLIRRLRWPSPVRSCLCIVYIAQCRPRLIEQSQINDEPSVWQGFLWSNRTQAKYETKMHFVNHALCS